MNTHKEIANLCNKGVSSGTFPGAAVAIGNKSGICYSDVFGNKKTSSELFPVEMNTSFDLASLTKVVATTTLFMKFLELGKISIYDTLSVFFKCDSDKEEISMKHLLTHTSGLKQHEDFRTLKISKQEAPALILSQPLQYITGTQVLYSDLGFIILGSILEKIGGDTLDALCKKYIFEPLGMNDTCFNPTTKNIAATEIDLETGLLIEGTVHDENARFFGGVSGHAGVFSNIADLSVFAKLLINYGLHDGKQFLSKATVKMMIHNYTAHLSENRSLGWCVKAYNNSSGGDNFSPTAFGHTGFTGTSIWISPDDDIFAVLLTNRVHPTRDNIKIIRFRRLFHNLVCSTF